MTPEQILSNVREIVEPVQLVGGCVRDILLNRSPTDYDMATPLTPDEVEARVKSAGRHVYAIGKKFGTIGFKVLNGTTPYYVEVTTYRNECYEPGNRKPKVEFVDDLTDDLSRRDFGMNAIAYDGENFIDPFGGRLDILEHKIKAVGNPKDRFTEDPLRMLRAARFSAQLGFDIDPYMIGMIRRMSRRIYTVSRERWVQEMDKLLTSDHPERGLFALQDSHLMRYMFPELSLLIEKAGVEWDDTLNALDMLRQYPMIEGKPDADQRWAILLANVGVPFLGNKQLDKGHANVARDLSKEIVTGIAARLKFSNDRAKLVIETAQTGIKS